MTEFEFHSLGELCEVKGGKRLPKGEQLTKIKTNHPYIRTRDLHNNQVSLSDLEYVPDAVFPKISRYIVNEGDIILSIVGTIGLIASIPKELDKASLTENCVKLVSIDNEVLDKNFLYYYLISKLGQDEIYVRNVGSTQPKLPIYNIKDIPVPLPPLPEQKAIAEVLSILDDKIELLQKQNETLEALAQTLFRQWFIEEADDSWEVTLIGDKLKTVLGGTPSKQIEEYWDGDVPWINSGMVNEFRVYKSSRNITVLGFNKSSTKLMPVGTTVVAITGATLGQISLLEIECCANQSVVGIIGNEEIPFWYVHLWITHMMPEIMLNETGGAQNHINKNDINFTKLVVPTRSYLNHKEDTFVSLYKKISLNVMEIETLRTTRDLLIPKLMSGQVRVKLD